LCLKKWKLQYYGTAIYTTGAMQMPHLPSMPPNEILFNLAAGINAIAKFYSFTDKEATSISFSYNLSQ
jgi:hypothetical protein